MKKRWLTLAVAATAAITVLAGCGSKTAETTAAATEAATTEAASSEAAESSAEETKAEAAAEGEVPAPEGDDNKISIGVTPVPHAEIVNDVAVPKLEAANDVEVVEFNDYVQKYQPKMVRSMQTISRPSVIWKSRTRKEDFI
ncbi:MAG: hypothetical protein ACLUV8_11900 [Clostridium sp.]